MDLEKLRDFALSLKGADESMPFGDDALVFKVGGRMFLLIGLQPPFRFTVKGTPENVLRYLEEYPEIIHPGYYMNKKHWVSVDLEKNLEADFIKKLVTDSRKLVVQKLPKKQQTGLL